MNNNRRLKTKTQLPEPKHCNGCDTDTTDFSPGVNVCRTCKSKSNALSNAIHNKVNLELKKASYRRKYPTLPDSGVYGLYDIEGKLMYIGESQTMPYRVYCHLGQWKNAASKFQGIDTTGWTAKCLWEGENELKRKMKEKHLIQTLLPKHNVIYAG